jgi:hypothetical protein
MLNWRRSYVHSRTGERAATIRELYRICSQQEQQLSDEFFESYLAGHGTAGLTAIRGIREGPGLFADAPRIVERGGGHGGLRERLGAELSGCETAVAVSGGIDCWLLAALLKSDGRAVRGWYLESGVPGYCERDQVLRMADAVGISCECIRVEADDFLRALPRFVAVTETPIYNLHPVSKLLLAEGLAKRGIRAVVSGDGADQVMRWDWNCDLLPLTLTCFEAAGVRLVAPFLGESVISLCRTPSADKSPVRALARQLGVPDVPKRPTLFPEIDGTAVADYSTRLLLEELRGRVA